MKPELCSAYNLICIREGLVNSPYIPGLHQQCFPRHAESMGHSLYWQHSHILKPSWRPCKRCLLMITVKELQWFLSFANFCRRFIRGFSTIAAPLTSMLRKGGNQLPWSMAATNSFQLLKEGFTTGPTLHHPDPEQEEFVVEIDVSSTGIGAVLSQRHGNPPRLYPCAYYSHNLNPAEQNYDVGNRELLTMKVVFEEWRHWLEGAKHPFLVLTDYNLEYLRSKWLNPGQARLALFFTWFKFTITYRPGSKNTKADTLSR